jgi:hypothetical protein
VGFPQELGCEVRSPYLSPYSYFLNMEILKPAKMKTYFQVLVPAFPGDLTVDVLDYVSKPQVDQL